MNKAFWSILFTGISIFIFVVSFSSAQVSSFSPFFVTSTTTNSGISTTTAAQLRRPEWVVGIGTSTPIGKFTIHGVTDDLLPYHFFVASSTPTATTTQFVIRNSGDIGVGTTTPGRLFSVAGRALFGSGTSTFETGLSISGGGVTISLPSCELATNALGAVICSTAGAGFTSFTLAGDGGTNQTISDANTLTIIGGRNLVTSGAATDNIFIDLENDLYFDTAYATSTLAVGSSTPAYYSFVGEGNAFISGTLRSGPIVSTSTLTLGSALTVANGGTGAATLTAGGVLLGQGTSAITTTGVLANGSVIVGDGVTDPTTLQILTASGGTLRQEVGGIEADISAITTGGLLRGTGAGTMGILTAGTRGTILSINTGGNVNWISTSTFAHLNATQTFTGVNSFSDVINASSTLHVTGNTFLGSDGSVFVNSSAPRNTINVTSLANGHVGFATSTPNQNATSSSAGVFYAAGAIRNQMCNLTDAVTIFVDGNCGNRFRVQMAGNRIIEFHNFYESQTGIITLQQDAIGSRIPVKWISQTPSGTRRGVVWRHGATTTLSTANNRIDKIGFEMGTDTMFMVASSTNFIPIDY